MLCCVCVCVICSVSDPDKRLQALWVICDSMPKNHKANLRWVLFRFLLISTHPCYQCTRWSDVFVCVGRYLVKFLARLAQDSEVNKMSPSNIAIVLGPNLLWAKNEG